MYVLHVSLLLSPKTHSLRVELITLPHCTPHHHTTRHQPQEVKAGDAARVRNLLARVTSLALPPKKMKGFFRWAVAGGDGLFCICYCFV